MLWKIKVSYNGDSMKTVLYIAVFCLCSLLWGGTLIHEYDFNNNMMDEYGATNLQPIHVWESSYSDGAWNWTASSTPGAGLLLGANLSSNANYSLRLVFKFNNFNPSWTKIVSFNGLGSTTTGYYSSDNGVYFSGSNIGFYNIAFSNTGGFSAGVWYDLLITRDEAGVCKVYIAPYGQELQQYISFADFSNLSKPDRIGEISYFGLFYDDTHTTAEWTSGGSVSLIQVWDSAINPQQVQNLQINESNGSILLSWNPAFGALSYNIYAADQPEGVWQYLGNTEATQYELSGFEPRKFYHIRAVR